MVSILNKTLFFCSNEANNGYSATRLEPCLGLPSNKLGKDCFKIHSPIFLGNVNLPVFGSLFICECRLLVTNSVMMITVPSLIMPIYTKSYKELQDK